MLNGVKYLPAGILRCAQSGSQHSPDGSPLGRRSTAEADGRPAPAGGFRRWSARKPPLVWVGLAVPLALLATDALMARWLLAMPMGLAAWVIGLVVALGAATAVAFAARVWSCLTLHYVLDDRVLTIVWGTARWVIPLAAIEDVALGQGAAVLVDGTLLPGCRVGRGYIKDAGKALFFSLLPPQQTLALRTADCTYLISPDGDDFLPTLAALRQVAGPAVASEPGAGPLALLRHPLGAFLAGAGTFLNALLHGYLCWWLPALPDRLPTHYSPSGLADGWDTPLALFWLPAIGTAVALLNIALVMVEPVRRQRAVGYVLLATSCLVQMFLWVAFVRLVP